MWVDVTVGDGVCLAVLVGRTVAVEVAWRVGCTRAVGVDGAIVAGVEAVAVGIGVDVHLG